MAMGGDVPENFRGLMTQMQRRIALLERAMDTKARQSEVNTLDKYILGAPGDVVWSSAASRPGALLADGSAVSRTTYANLFAAIGTTYGAGNGSTTFNLPDLRGRVIVGRNSGDTAFNTLGKKGGEKEHTLTSAEMPSHTHSFSATTSSDSHTHSFSATTSSDSHTHSFSATTSNDTHSHGTSDGRDFVATDGNVAINLTGRNFPSSGGNANFWYSQGENNVATELSRTDTDTHHHSVSGTTGSDSHSHSVSGTTGSDSHSHTVSGTTGSSGSGAAHNNLQPYVTLNPFIVV